MLRLYAVVFTNYNFFIMSKFLLFVSAATMSMVVVAAPRSAEQALVCAQAFYAHQVKTGVRKAVLGGDKTIRLAATMSRKDYATPAFYVFNQGVENGYVLVSADDRVPEILGYSDAGFFNEEDMPENMNWWLEQYQYQISSLPFKDSIEHNVPVPDNFIKRPLIATEVKPLLGDIAWNQGAPYNNMCPDATNREDMNRVDYRRAPTGCIATAVAQVMRYYKYPSRGTGSKTYKPEYVKQPLSVNFDTDYDWDNMLPCYDNVQYNNTQANAVAKLMYHVGVACETGYTSKGSGSGYQNALYALTTYFRYSKDARRLQRKYDASTWEEWENIVRNELNHKRPVLYGGGGSNTHPGGHAFVCDGYNKEGYFHINWGWGKGSSGYYLLTILENQYEQGHEDHISHDAGFAYNQDVIINIKPEEGGSIPNIAYLQYDDIVCSSTEIKTNHTLNVQIKNLGCRQGYAQGQLGLWLATSDGSNRMIIQHRIDMREGSSQNYTFDVTMNSQITDVKKISIVYQPDHEKVWYNVTGPHYQQYDIQVSYSSDNGLFHIQPPAIHGTLQAKSFSTNKLLLSNEDNILTLNMTYTNSTNPYFNDSVYIVFTNTTTNVNHKFGPHIFTADLNQTQSLSLHITLPAGVYYIDVQYYKNDSTSRFSTPLTVLSSEEYYYMPTNLQVTTTDTKCYFSWDYEHKAEKYKLVVSHLELTKGLIRFFKIVNDLDTTIVNTSLSYNLQEAISYFWSVTALSCFDQNNNPQVYVTTQGEPFQIQLNKDDIGTEIEKSISCIPIRKYITNNHVVIERNGQKYAITGQRIK